MTAGRRPDVAAPASASLRRDLPFYPAAAYFALMFAALITFAHFSVSDAM
jgi:hypothetical protein